MTNNSAEWEFSQDIYGTVRQDEVPIYKVASSDVSKPITSSDTSQSSNEIASTIGKVIGTVVLLALFGLFIYASTKNRPIQSNIYASRPLTVKVDGNPSSTYNGDIDANGHISLRNNSGSTLSGTKDSMGNVNIRGNNGWVL
ncbi:MAG: hypothetical protein NTV00_16055, partial [Methylococcales bacterium]|nr:hypothetical protein [Methylococcales bacterium]